MELIQNSTVRQSQNLSQFQSQYYTLLVMTTHELDEYMTGQFQENPMLEMLPPEKKISVQDRPEVLRSVAAPPMHHRYAPFIEQLNLLAYSEETLHLMRKMIDCLDENGYYPLSSDETAALFSVPVSEAEYCLQTLQGLEPAGVFARNLQDCLILQLHRREIHDELLEGLIRDCPEVLSPRCRKSALEKTGVSPAVLKKYRELISTLNPRPFYKADCRKNRQVIPDILCSYTGGDWEITIEEKNNYTLNSFYLSLSDGLTEQEQEYLCCRKDEAKQLLAAVALRNKTLKDLALFIARYQQNTLLYGWPPKPLTMISAAEALGISESTVSRACRGKYLEAPAGSFTFRELFPTKASEGGHSEQQIKQRLRELISEEDPGSPRSDELLRTLLGQEQMVVSRRTVAKYRAALGIPETYRRKRGSSTHD